MPVALDLQDGSVPGISGGSPSNPADVALQFALAQVGKPYVWGATGPNSYDCSGLVQAAYKAAGISLPRTTYLMLAIGTPIPPGQQEPGDLIFPDAGHVQLWLGNDEVVESPSTGKNVRVVQQWGIWQVRRVTTPASGQYATGTAGDSGTSQTSLWNAVGKISGNLLSPSFWNRLGKGAAGAGVLALGVIVWHEGLGKTAQSAARKVM